MQVLWITLSNFNKWNNFHRENWVELLLTCYLQAVYSYTCNLEQAHLHWSHFWGKKKDKITQPPKDLNSTESTFCREKTAMRSHTKNSYTREHIQLILKTPSLNIWRGCDFCAGTLSFPKLSSPLEPLAGHPAKQGLFFNALLDKEQITRILYNFVLKTCFLLVVTARIIKWKSLCFDKCWVKLAMLQNIQ